MQQAWDGQEQWLIAILDTIDEGIHAVDAKGHTIFYNRAAARLDGLSPADVIGKHVLDAFPSLAVDTSTLLQVLKTGKAIHNQAQVYTNYLGVKVHTVNTTLPILSAGNVVGALEVAKDLTQVRRLAEQVLALQAQVADDRRRTAGFGMTSRRVKPAAEHSTALYRFAHILTEDPRMQQLLQRAQRAAETMSPILVFGETGTGKELLVQAIHNEGPRRQAPFLALNCAALPGSLLEGILFGTVRGSFTGAEDRPGLFELADEGTLFLDEIQSMPLELQAKLLRVLQEGELMRVGDTRVRRVKVRVVAAMNVLPETAVERGMLRADLYYRVNVVRLDIPPLRERRGDVRMLVRHFLDKWNQQLGTAVEGLTPAAWQLLEAYPWPGNVRELENAIEAALNLVPSGWLDADALPGPIRDFALRRHLQPVTLAAEADTAARAPVPEAMSEAEWVLALERAGMSRFWQGLWSTPPVDVSWRGMQAVFERMVLQRALAGASGNVKAAAERLGIPRQTLQYRLKQLGV
ncbi:arginine utilization regulatory protein [Alicyclobacillus contaminans]|uniref:sigma-54 interaction domain-containing protein n=1 Tax=Alicyclobacillus contaminans TaxID=392016 RepID=UPI00041F1469|nr:sigma-54-dependent Fis family transcriptional regulator [Alicyclobacillus contaminans]GMA50844.1 arginine utilization regulatory protein [Alicyclobacillus contaminans]